MSNEQLSYVTRDLWGQGDKGEQAPSCNVRCCCCSLDGNLFYPLIEALGSLSACMASHTGFEQFHYWVDVTFSLYFFFCKFAIKWHYHNHRICSKERLVRKGENTESLNLGTTPPFLSNDKTTKLERVKGKIWPSTQNKKSLVPSM